MFNFGSPIPGIFHYDDMVITFLECPMFLLEEFLECPMLVDSFRLDKLMEPIMRIVTTISVIFHVDRFIVYDSQFSDDQRTAAGDRLNKKYHFIF